MADMSPEAVRVALAQRIAALPVEDSGYGHLPDDAWHESTVPLVPEWEPENRSHLAFWVDDRQHDDQFPSHSGPNQSVEARSPVVIRFLFEQRPGSRTEDWDGAVVAARHLLSDLLGDDTDDYTCTSAGAGLIRRIPINLDGGTWLAVEVRIVVQFSFSLTFP